MLFWNRPTLSRRSKRRFLLEQRGGGEQRRLFSWASVCGWVLQRRVLPLDPPGVSTAPCATSPRRRTARASTVGWCRVGVRRTVGGCALKSVDLDLESISVFFPQALALVGSLARSMGSPIQREIRPILSEICKNLADAKPAVRAAVSSCLEQLAEAAGIDWLLPSVLETITKANCGPDGKLQALLWLSKALGGGGKGASDVPNLVRIALVGLSDKTAEARAAGDQARLLPCWLLMSPLLLPCCCWLLMSPLLLPCCCWLLLSPLLLPCCCWLLLSDCRGTSLLLNASVLTAHMSCCLR